MIRNTTIVLTPAKAAMAKVTPEDMLRNVIQTARGTRTAALALVASATGFMLLVNHFRETDVEGYMSRNDAVKFLKDQIAKQAEVKGGMLDIYVSRADTLYSKIVGSVKQFGPFIKELAEAKDADTIGTKIGNWLSDKHGIQSLAELSVQLGYKTGRPTDPIVMTPAKALERVDNTMTAISKIVGSGAGKVQERQIAQHIALAINNKLALVREGIKAITDLDDLKAVEDAVKDQRKMLASLSAEATKAAKAKPKTKVTAAHKALAAKIKDKGTQHTAA